MNQSFGAQVFALILAALLSGSMAYAQVTPAVPEAEIEMNTQFDGVNLEINGGSGGCQSGEYFDIVVGGCTEAVLVGSDSRACSCACPDTYTGFCSAAQNGDVYGWRLPPSGSQQVSHTNWGACTQTANACVAPPPPPPPPQSLKFYTYSYANFGPGVAYAAIGSNIANPFHHIGSAFNSLTGKYQTTKKYIGKFTVSDVVHGVTPTNPPSLESIQAVFSYEYYDYRNSSSYQQYYDNFVSVASTPFEAGGRWRALEVFPRPEITCDEIPGVFELVVDAVGPGPGNSWLYYYYVRLNGVLYPINQYGSYDFPHIEAGMPTAFHVDENGWVYWPVVKLTPSGRQNGICRAR